MGELIAFLNANSGALNLLFAAVVAAATVVYAWLTAKLVSETRRLRQVQTEPHIEVFYRSRDEWISLLDVVAKNIGNGPAYDVRFGWEATVSNKGSENLLARLRELKGFSSGIAYLGPDQEFSSFWTQMTEDFEDKLATQIRVRSTCRGATGLVYERQHLLDLSELKGISRIGEPPFLKMAKSLDAIQKDLRHIATGFNRPKVDVFTHEDRERERQELEERMAQLRGQQTQK
jgi:hypothetical protein